MESAAKPPSFPVAIVAGRAARPNRQSTFFASDDPDLERKYAEAVAHILYGTGDLAEGSEENTDDEFRTDSPRSEQPHRPSVSLTSGSHRSTTNGTGPSPSSPRSMEFSSPTSGSEQKPESNRNGCGASKAMPASSAPSWSRSKDPSLQRGWNALKNLATIDLPQTVTSRLPGLLHIIAMAVGDCYAACTRPTVPAIRAQLRKWSISEEVHQSVLPVVARDPFRFQVSLPDDGIVSVLLVGRSHEGVFTETRSDHSAYTNSFLELLAERCFQAVGAHVEVTAATRTPMYFNGEQALAAPSSTRSVTAARHWSDEHYPVHHAKQPLRLVDAIPAARGTTDAPSVPRQLHPGEQAATSAQARSGLLADALVADGVTTLMVRNLPRHITKKRFLEELAQAGFQDSFDFFYTPSDITTGAGKGYAFINFVSAQHVGRFVRVWHGSTRFLSSDREIPLSVSRANTQGLDQNTKKWDASRLRRVRNPALRPWIADRSCWAHKNDP